MNRVFTRKDIRMTLTYMKWCSCTHNKKTQLESTLRYYFSSIKLTKMLRTHFGKAIRKQSMHTHTLLVRTQTGRISVVAYKIVNGFTHWPSIPFYTKDTPLQTSNDVHNLLWSAPRRAHFALHVGLLSSRSHPNHVTETPIPCTRPTPQHRGSLSTFLELLHPALLSHPFCELENWEWERFNNFGPPGNRFQVGWFGLAFFFSIQQFSQHKLTS